MAIAAARRIRTWWRRASLIQRLVLVAMVPSIVSTIFLAVLLTQHQIRSTREMLRSTASAYVAQAAAVASNPMRRHDLVELDHVAHSISQLPHVNQVRILDANGRQLVNEHNRNRTHHPAGAHMQVRHTITDGRTPGRVLGTLLVDIDTHTSLLAQHVSIFDTLLWLSIAILLAILLSWQQARWISAPLRRLSMAMRGLGRIDRAQQVDVTDDSEIGELQRGFNNAAAALHAMHRDMERRIQDATEELAHKNAALEQASEAKARFLAGATHDLRQPLYALTLFSSGLAEKETNPERLDRIVHVQQCIESLDRLFGELLDLSRLEAGAMQPEMRDFPLDEIFQEVSRNFRIQAEKQELRLVTRPTRVWVHTDRTMLGRILNNLVSNALRYTLEGGVLVGARRRGDRIRIDVRDTGVGVSEEHQAHIFEEFYRIDDSQHKELATRAAKHGQRGLGLGLSTVKRLAEMLGAECRMTSTPGRGTLFTLTVPVSEKIPQHSETSTGEIAFAPAPSHDLQGVRILMIDDDEAILAGMHDLLSNWGCQAHEAIDEKTALEKIAAMPEPPQLVITDLHLGGGSDGVETLHKLARHLGSVDGEMPFACLLITGETDRRRLAQARASHLPILFKPVSAQVLRDSMLKALRQYRDASRASAAHETSAWR